MLKIGGRVKLNIEKLESINFTGLYDYENTTGKDNVSYILANQEKEYTVVEIDQDCKSSPYVLDDEYLKETSFSEDELIIIE
jgi:hypothetical protein